MGIGLSRPPASNVQRMMSTVAGCRPFACPRALTSPRLSRRSGPWPPEAGFPDPRRVRGPAGPRRGGPGGVEYVLAPDPNLGPWEALAPREVLRLVRAANLRVVESHAAEPS